MIRRRLVTFLVGLCAVLFFYSQAQAITLFDDSSGLGTGRAAWITAVGSYLDVDIATQVPVNTYLETSESLVLGYGRSANFDRRLQGRQVGVNWSTWSLGQTPALLFGAGATSVIGTFDAPVYAFGVEAEPNPFSTLNMSLALSDGSVVNQAVIGDKGAKFFGWAGSEPISSFTLSIVSNDFAFGRMVIGQATSGGPVIPEPATLSLFGLGLLGMFIRSKRK